MLPFFNLFGETIYSYPLMMGIAWGVAFQFFHSLQRKSQINFKNMKIFLGGIFLSAWIGAKVFFIITSQGLIGKGYLTNSNFWLGGGFVFYGGLIFGLLFVIIYNKYDSHPWKDYGVLIPSLALGHGIGRIGCFLTGCCHGKLWYHSDHGDINYPVQLYEALGLFVLSFLGYRLFSKGKGIVLFYLFSYGVLRFILEFMRGDEIRGIWALGLSTSQIISLVFIIFSVVSYIYLKRIGPKVSNQL